MKNNLKDPIYTDSRGEIRRFNFNSVKFNVITSKKGIYRSGDFHKSTQYDIILKGEAKITLRVKGKNITVVKKENEFIKIPPNIPHLFYFPKETVMIEWWDKEFEASFFKPYRELVLKSIKKLHKF